MSILSPREWMLRADARHRQRLRVEVDRRVRYEPLPTRPIYEVGDWEGAEFEPTAQSAGEAQFNKVIVQGQDAAGSPVWVERYAGQQPGVLLERISSPAFSNPSFDTDLSGWTSSNFQRDTTTFHTSPASAFAPGGAPIQTTLTGTFKRGVIYVIVGRVRHLAPVPRDARFQLFVGGELQAEGVLPVPLSNVWYAPSVAWFPRADASSVVFKAAGPLGFGVWYDTFTVSLPRATLPDRRGFLRTKVLQIGMAINEGDAVRLADAFLEKQLRTPFAGQLTTKHGGIRQAGRDVHPAELLTNTEELILFRQLIDPDTGAQGRMGRIAAVEYDHKTETARVAIDDAHSGFSGVLQSYGVEA